MTLADIFGGMAAAGLAIQLWLLREAWLDEQARRTLGVNGILQRVSGMHLRSAGMRVLVLLLLTAAAVAAIIPNVRPFSGWALVPLPGIILVTGLLDWRTRLQIRQLGGTP